jgi:hypothetical protein
MWASNGERPPSAPILLSSDAFDERDRFDAWREELMLRVMRVDVDVPDKRSFHTRLRMLHLPNVSIIERRSTPSVVTRTAEFVRWSARLYAFPPRQRNDVRVIRQPSTGPASRAMATVKSRFRFCTTRRAMRTSSSPRPASNPTIPARSSLAATPGFTTASTRRFSPAERRPLIGRPAFMSAVMEHSPSRLRPRRRRSPPGR